MKHSYILVCLLALVGCSHNISEPKTPEAPKSAMKPDKDNFDVAGEKAASGSRWVWNKTTEAYEWATSEETKKRASNYYEAIKRSAGNMYEDTKNGIDAYQNKRSK